MATCDDGGQQVGVVLLEGTTAELSSVCLVDHSPLAGTSIPRGSSSQ